MRASLELTTGALRIHEIGGHGDPYVWACTVVVTPNGEAWLLGVTSPVTPAIFRAIGEELARHGISIARWERRINGERRMVSVKVPPLGDRRYRFGGTNGNSDG